MPVKARPQPQAVTIISNQRLTDNEARRAHPRAIGVCPAVDSNIHKLNSCIQGHYSFACLQPPSTRSWLCNKRLCLLFF